MALSKQMKAGVGHYGTIQSLAALKIAVRGLPLCAFQPRESFSNKKIKRLRVNVVGGTGRSTFRKLEVKKELGIGRTRE